MEFNPNNNVVKLCMMGMANEDSGKREEAHRLLLKAWNEATHDFEKYIAAYYFAKSQANATDQLKWYETSLQFALSLNSDVVNGALPTLYTRIAQCYEVLGDVYHAKKIENAPLHCAKLRRIRGHFIMAHGPTCLLVVCSHRAGNPITRPILP